MNKTLLLSATLLVDASSFLYLVEEDMQRSVRMTSQLVMELAEHSVSVCIDDEEREAPVQLRTY